ncbi:hypothetical protein HHJ99_09790 [Staphylococcus caprae]|nr:hypothetical protein HHJ99_09790 [Staphylococcus caprae]
MTIEVININKLYALAFLLIEYEEYTGTSLFKDQDKLGALVRLLNAINSNNEAKNLIEQDKLCNYIEIIQRQNMTKNEIDLDSRLKSTIVNIIKNYAQFSSWYLEKLATNLVDNTVYSQNISEAIPKLVKDEKNNIAQLRLYDPICDMFIDEFEDIDEETMTFGY